ncbi:hypothetical protein [Pseudomonas sp. PDNC002]|nr:hypothetical protein [Pseudomonas sp. PDNC002]
MAINLGLREALTIDRMLYKNTVISLTFHLAGKVQTVAQKAL